jgi:hypothetical protein
MRRNDDVVQLIAAMKAALDDWREHDDWAGIRRDRVGVHADAVARRLAGLRAATPPPEIDRTIVPDRPTGGDVIRVGKALARLERAGLTRRVSRSWQPNRWALAE